MAGLIVSAGLDNAVEVSLSAGTEKNVLQLRTASNHGAKLLAWGVSFDGVTAAESPVEVVMARITGGTLGTGTVVCGNGTNVGKANPSSPEAIQTIVERDVGVGSGVTREVLYGEEIHPQAGGIKIFYPYGQEEYAPGGGVTNDGVFAIFCKAAVGVNCKPWFKFEE